jgi:PadR family transcriptional regulator, regulatory protein PadR
LTYCAAHSIIRHMIPGQAQLDAYDKISLEMRRGVLILAALSQLEERKYGYALITQLADYGLDIDQGTLYPLLRRLESQGLLDSSWVVEGARPRRYYAINANGRAVLTALKRDWLVLEEMMRKLLAEDGG